MFCWRKHMFFLGKIHSFAGEIIIFAGWIPQFCNVFSGEIAHFLGLNQHKLGGSQADGVDGVIHSATRLALQLFLNSERAGQIDKAREDVLRYQGKLWEIYRLNRTLLKIG